MRATFWIKALCIILTFINNYTYSYAKPTEKRKHPFDVVVNSDVIFWRQEASYNEWRFVCISGAEVHPKNKNKILNPPHQISIYDSNPKKIKELFAAIPDSVKKCPDSVYVNSNVTTKDGYQISKIRGKIIRLKNGKGKWNFAGVLRSDKHVFNTEPGKMVYAIGTVYIDWLHPEKNHTKVKFKELKPRRKEDTMEWLYRQEDTQF
ncbi:MAG: hypothetical protein IKT30_04500 [Bacteroidaceae bacterium]|nr:hypothetical protein [Bacteroidaceae bacterium]